MVTEGGVVRVGVGAEVRPVDPALDGLRLVGVHEHGQQQRDLRRDRPADRPAAV